ncbi:hypothetical protein [Phyllobacterium zundukense]|uniref:Uncharacterized protein n=1 Tax=Phyllobacterium zundukense TaxID=1867719 RepID=A0ACD4CYW0_9HYPH|nr:hypothetical protein [Phyllobacterium zundukense]UXN58785.1 hypothetical protein N8E88_07635 [Phyllobacterium zundukense]
MDKIIWQKTSVGAEEPSHEFTAIAPNGIDVGRIYRIDGGPLKGRWRWIFLLGHSQFRQGIMSGDQASKQRAANQVWKTYERYLETPGFDGGGQSRIPLKKQSNQIRAI